MPSRASFEAIRRNQTPSEVLRRTEPIEEIVLRDAPITIEIERGQKGRELEMEAYRYACSLPCKQACEHAKGT